MITLKMKLLIDCKADAKLTEAAESCLGVLISFYVEIPRYFSKPQNLALSYRKVDFL